MATADSGSSSGHTREELSSASVSITPIPVEELDDGRDEPRPQGRGSSTAKTAPPPRPEPAIIALPAETRPRKAQPSRGVARYLFGSERYVGEWRRHWIHVVAWVALGVASPFIVGYLIGLLGPSNTTAVWLVLTGWVLAFAIIAWMVIGWWLERFVLTDKRVLLVSGIISRRVAMMPLARVTDMAYVQSPLGIMLDYGTFVLESAGQDQALRDIKPLPHPNELYLLFCQEMYDPGAIEKEAEENAPEGDHSAT